GATTGKGSSNSVSSRAWGSDGDNGGSISARIRFQVNRIFPRFIPCSSSSGGSVTFASARSASASLMASGQAPDSWASGTTNGSIGAADEGAAGAATGAGAAAAGCSAGVGAGCIRKADGAGKGVEGLMGDDVNGELGVIGCTGCWAGACRAAGFGAETGAEAGASLGEIADSG